MEPTVLRQILVFLTFREPKPQGSGDVSGETEMQLGNEWYGVVDIHRD